MSIEEEVMHLILPKQAELESLGFTEQQAVTAIKRARKFAEKTASKVRESIREEVFLDYLKLELDGSQKWLEGVRQSFPAWKSGLDSSDMSPGPETQEAYRSWSA